MSKVTITIDDANPDIIAIFGEKSINNIAQVKGYMDDVYKEASELPEMVDSGKTYFDPILQEDRPVMEYPEGTVLTKKNPETREQFVGRVVFEGVIMPDLLKDFENKVRAQMNSEALAKAQVVIEQGRSALKAGTKIIVE